MISKHTSKIPPPHVVVRFGDGAHSFVLPAGATFAELAVRIDNLGAMHETAPIAVHVEFGKSVSRRATAAGARGTYFN